MTNQASGFFVAPFVIDGEMEELGFWELGSLSGKWLATCGKYLDEHGDSFDETWGGNLSHIQTKFTAASGFALVTFEVNGLTASSIAFASGLSPVEELALLKMYVDSLRRVDVVRKSAASSEPFQKVFAIKERPLMVVVPWTNSAILPQDHALVRELAVHTAGAYFAKRR
jgi:hypothetical protein